MTASGSALYVCHDAFGGRGGIAKYNRELLGALAELKALDRIVSLPRYAPVDPIGVLPPKIEQSPTNGTGKMAFAAAILATALRPPALRLVVCGHLNLLPVAWIAARLRGAALIMPLHGIEAWEPTGRIADRLARMVDLALPVSAVTDERFRAWSGLPAHRSRVVANCVAPGEFQPGPAPANLRAMLGLDGRRVVMSLGRMDVTDRRKGNDELITAWPQLLAQHPDLTLVLAGDGDDRPRLQEMASGLRDSVIFPGYIGESEKADYLRLADVFVLCGVNEGFGIVLLEAMACGVPVVASSRDGSREAVLDGAIGELADPDVPGSIADAIDRALRREKGIVPDELSRFHVDQFRREIRETIESLLNPACARAEGRTSSLGHEDGSSAAQRIHR